jgi:hypothetical protein
LPFDDDSEPELQRKVVKMDYFMPTYFSAGKKLVTSTSKLLTN